MIDRFAVDACEGGPVVEDGVLSNRTKSGKAVGRFPRQRQANRIVRLCYHANPAWRFAWSTTYPSLSIYAACGNLALSGARCPSR